MSASALLKRIRRGQSLLFRLYPLYQLLVDRGRVFEWMALQTGGKDWGQGGTNMRIW